MSLIEIIALLSFLAFIDLLMGTVYVCDCFSFGKFSNSFNDFDFLLPLLIVLIFIYIGRCKLIELPCFILDKSSFIFIEILLIVEACKIRPSFLLLIIYNTIIITLNFNINFIIIHYFFFFYNILIIFN